MFLLALVPLTLQANPADDAAAIKVADAWLAMVDANDHQGSWEATGELFKGEVSAEEWGEAMAAVREEMGAVTQRLLRDLTRESVMPGAPEGEYVLMEYGSTFEKQGRGAELVVCMKEEGEWRVVGYFVQ
ncbi:MAG: DUF4019 domain-containing protein [Thioalkalivibrio sp.]